MGVLVAMTCFIVSDRHRSNATSVALAAGLLWPLVILGALQLGLVMGAQKLSRDPVSSVPPL